MDNKTAIITGASRGIGAAIALQLARDGFNIVVNYNSSEENAENVVNECKSFGVDAIKVKADVSSYEECKKLVEISKEKFPSIDVLVNNAGITKDGLILRMKEEDFDSVINANLKSTFNMISLVTPIMVKQKNGKIINISSVAGVHGNKGQLNYSASKAGVIGITKSASKELGARNITVNAIAPGFIETDMTNALNDKMRETVIENTSLKRLGKVDEIAYAASFLASNKADYITGQVIQVDGGLIL